MSKNYLSAVFSFSLLISGLCHAEEFEFDDFLGTLGGTQVYVRSYEKSYAEEEQKTYSRSFEKFGPLDIRVDVATAGNRDLNPLGFKQIGEEYRFGRSQRFIQGGGFFLTLKELEGTDARLFSFQYALNVIEKQLEQTTGIPLKELQAQSWAYGIGYLINRYFECITMPEDGDLAIYPNAIGTPHVGLYKKSKRNSNSPPGGTIESKWGPTSPFVFQHDVFFTPDYYGDLVQFYRLKKTTDSIITLKEESLTPCPTHTLRDDGYFEFNNTKESIRIREEIDQSFGWDLVRKIPEIRLVKHIKFIGFCYDYAFGAIFKTYTPPRSMPSMPSNDWIEKYFSITTEPQKGDLVCYYTELSQQPVHYGIYDSPNLVESKWGQQHVYKHLPFYVTNRYGNFIRYYRLKSELTLEAL